MNHDIDQGMDHDMATDRASDMASGANETRSEHPLMGWLAAGIPLSLLLDLGMTGGPASPDIYREEPADTRWITFAA